MRTKGKGFSLVEIMVALVIGMLAMIIMLQMFAVFEGRKRTTTGAADAQTNGAIAMHMIESDARMGGWGMNPSNYSKCSAATTYSYCDGSAACGGTAGTIKGLSFGSVRVTDGGSDPDTISAQYYANPNFNNYEHKGTLTIRKNMPKPSAELEVNSVKGCEPGDLMLVSQEGNCTLMEVTHVDPVSLKIQHNPGTNGIYNPPEADQQTWPKYTVGATMTCFPSSKGAMFSSKIYSVDTAARQLLKTDNTLDVPVANEAVVHDVFDLQAQYGIADAGTNVINAWVNATAPGWDAPSFDDQKRIKAIRVAILARSGQYEKPDPGKTCANTSSPATTTTVLNSLSTWAKFDPKNYPGDWQCFRYKAFETVIPVRNIIWANL